MSEVRQSQSDAISARAQWQLVHFPFSSEETDLLIKRGETAAKVLLYQLGVLFPFPTESGQAGLGREGEVVLPPVNGSCYLPVKSPRDVPVAAARLSAVFRRVRQTKPVFVVHQGRQHRHPRTCPSRPLQTCLSSSQS